MPHAFVTGYPVGHSLSPQIHRYWLKKYHLAGSYEAFEIKPEHFEKFIASLPDKGLCGGNVTLPHKEMAFKIVLQQKSARPIPYGLKIANSVRAIPMLMALPPILTILRPVGVVV